MKKIKGDADFEDEMVVLKQAQKLLDQESALASEIKTKQLELDNKTVTHYAKLSVDEIKELVVNDKWFARLSADVESEVERVTQSLASSVKELEQRYAHPMPELTEKVADYSARVEEHLKKMGLSW